MDNCSRHKKEILGVTDMHALAEMIGDLHYQSLSEFLINLAAKIKADGEKDEQAGRLKLAKELSGCAQDIYSAEQKMLNAWYICKPYMEQQSHTTCHPQQ